ncbi:MAG: membrane protein insertion efficiency factor YidD [Planctomycetota bacterium]
MRRLLVLLVEIYRRLISPLLPPMCRFEPTCSAYARDALLTHGALKGTLLAVWRVLRCNPLIKGGLYDPVPPPGRWR